MIRLAAQRYCFYLVLVCASRSVWHRRSVPTWRDWKTIIFLRYPSQLYVLIPSFLVKSYKAILKLCDKHQRRSCTTNWYNCSTQLYEIFFLLFFHLIFIIYAINPIPPEMISALIVRFVRTVTVMWRQWMVINASIESYRLNKLQMKGSNERKRQRHRERNTLIICFTRDFD